MSMFSQVYNTYPFLKLHSHSKGVYINIFQSQNMIENNKNLAIMLKVYGNKHFFVTDPYFPLLKV